MADEEPRQDGDMFLLETKMERIEREQKEAKEREEQYKNLQVKFNSRMVLFTFGLLIASILADFISGYVASVGKQSADAATSAADTARRSLDSSSETSQQTLREMHTQSDAMRDAAEFTRQTAEASRRNADIATRSLLSAQRAYVSYGEWKMNFAADVEITFEATMTNSGNIPAAISEMKFEQFIAPALPKSPMYSDFSNKGADVQIQAHERVRQYISGRKITTAGFAAIRSGTSKLWIYGEITYTDSISGKHKIGFCERYDPRMNDFFRERVAGFNYGD